ncbi:ABC transporter substrate-binding protein [Pseudomonas sp. RTC3]|uniref:ABC transporter substrate-binding protein n=1 Tax=unclassified Pseudomonas TaxID=196821 RepID=UPI002AB58E16|nr:MULTISPECIES: ABC transporter substrate-binding protein [unclassified Pseudomonas]MEB0060479.1 ABC transporter substrate-binding protein [Pseudomonas sp. RTC3]MDY7568165.1 ABC transporter substrate-binding protein [Pseudomonas sp. 5C2]MEB0024282.1 ABC transporter substrate-binding protein [Pseudomonas sp. MH9.2]MEB0148493.1 ABC transporter substrate-binding protein [Pseudomonas sp. CCC2.2]MEE3508598.1 ABC transporter substrate-binding protein [Pseudomonas sp. 10C3]
MLKRTFVRSLALALSLTATALTAHADNEQYFPLQSYRVGPYAAGGTGFFGGFIDYMQYVNANGGVNGVKLTWSECETEYVVEKGVECYERLKKGLNGAPAAATNPLSVGIAYATLERSTADKLPLITINHGRTDSTDGSVFPYVFPLQLNPYSEVSAIINYIGQQAGGLDKLKGKKIVTLYHGSPYGKETNEVLQTLADKYGFELTLAEVPHPGNEQQSQWLNIRRAKPDWVILRGWGVMNPVALKTAQKVGYPADHIIGNIWSNSEEDAAPAGAAAKGFISITTHPSGTDFPVLQGIKKSVLDAGKGNLEDPKRFGTVYYNLGVVNGILNVEAVRIAQEKFGKKPLTGEQVRWGFEHLNIDEARLKALGAEGLVQPLKLSCSDHEGGGAVRFQQWDGQKWNLISDWVQADRALLRPIIEASSHKYAQEKGIAPRDCSKES